MPLAVPLIMAGGTIGAGLIGRSAANRAMKQQQPLMDAQAAAAQEQLKLARMLAPNVSGAADYYNKILHGDRAALTSAIQPELTGVTEMYRGAEKGLDRMAPGAGRDQARAELGRQRVGQLGGLYFGARQNAAQTGINLTGAATGATGGAANIYSTLLNGMRDDRDFNDRQQTAFGAALGPLFVDLYKAWQTKKPAGIPKIGATGFGMGMGGF